MKNWTKPEIDSIRLNNTETFKSVKIDRFGEVRVDDYAVVKSEGSEIIDIPS